MLDSGCEIIAEICKCPECVGGGTCVPEIHGSVPLASAAIRTGNQKEQTMMQSEKGQKAIEKMKRDPKSSPRFGFNQKGIAKSAMFYRILLSVLVRDRP